MKQRLWQDIATASGFSLDSGQIALLDRYRLWLIDEAIPAGGIGPEEGSRLLDRHIGDSLTFAWPFSSQPPGDLLDVGSGVGLPGIPLAIMWPESAITLLDRSQKRVDLARRAIRVLGVDNVETLRADLTEVDTRFSAVVTRAAIPPEKLASMLSDLIRPGGMAVAGGSWSTPPTVGAWETLEIPTEMLDRPVWLLIMRAA